MNAFSVPQRRKPPNRSKAVTCALINQFATPGLGSIVGKRFISGTGQLLFALAGFCLLVVWIAYYSFELSYALAGGAPIKYSYAWTGRWGLICLGVSWFWSLATSLSMLRQAKAEAQAVPSQTSAPLK